MGSKEEGEEDKLYFRHSDVELLQFAFYSSYYLSFFSSIFIFISPPLIPFCDISSRSTLGSFTFSSPF